MMHTDQLYFNKDHEMVRKAVRDFVKKEITPTLRSGKKLETTPGNCTRKLQICYF